MSLKSVASSAKLCFLWVSLTLSEKEVCNCVLDKPKKKILLNEKA